MKSRTIVLPMAFAVPAFVSTVPQSVPALASESSVAQLNPLLGELDTVIAGARGTSILVDRQVAAMPPSTQATNSRISSTCKNGSRMNYIKLGTVPPTGIRRTQTPPPAKKSNPTGHKA